MPHHGTNTTFSEESEDSGFPSGKRQEPDSICDYRKGCALITELFPETFALAQLVICSKPHLAEALFQLGLTAYGRPSTNMALAIQEARTDPPSRCGCSRS